MAGKSISEIFTMVKPYLLMVALQFGWAGMYVTSKVSLNHGMSRYVLIVYRNTIAFLVLAPFALVLERTRPKMTLATFLQIMALGFLDPVIDQHFSFLGMTYTSASFVSSIANVVPSVTFLMAVIFRESKSEGGTRNLAKKKKKKKKEVRGIAKIVGTIVTFGGAILMTVYKGPIINLWSGHHAEADGSGGGDSHKHWIAGTFFILIGCCAWSAFFILESITVRKYPAELSLSARICLLGALQSSVVALVAERHASAWVVGWDFRLLAPIYTGVVNSGITYYVQGLVLKTRGPVFVTAFNPLCMVIVAALGTLILAEKLYLGSIIGGVIIAVGLYSVVWGKGKDYNSSATAGAANGVVKDNGAQTLELPITAKVDTTQMADK